MNSFNSEALKYICSITLNSVIFCIVLEATRRNESCSKATFDEITYVVKDHLRFSGDRDGGRRQRKR